MIPQSSIFANVSLIPQCLQNDFWVIHGTDFPNLFAQSHIGQFQVSPRIQKHIVWFNVTMNVPQCVNTGYRMRCFGHKESSDMFAKGILLDEHTHEITAGTEFHHHVQVCFIHKTIMQGSQPTIFGTGLGQCFTLSSDMAYLILQNHHFLLHGFESINLNWFVTLFLITDQSNFPKGSPSNNCQRIKISGTHSFSRMLLQHHFLLFQVLSHFPLFVLRNTHSLHLTF
mmetsp:Transcript_39196/g.94787  ORF Transcript_39196/g.94787 Transcript_39196/m.94787 type:complete len:227 (-) Transcript_39196:453-1133(-)